MSTVFDETIEEVSQQKAQTPETPAQPEAELQPSPAEPSGEETQQVEEKAESTSPEFESFVEERKGQHGESWAIRSARELYEDKRKNKPVLDLAQTHGTEILKVGAQIASVCLDPQADGQAMADAIFASLPESQRPKLRDVVWGTTCRQFPDATVEGLYGHEFPGVTSEEVKRALKNEREFGQPQTDEDDLSQLSPELRKEIEDGREFRKKFPDFEQQFSTLRTKVQSTEESERERQQDSIGNELYNSVWSTVSERISKLGLEIKPTDSINIRGIKEALNNRLSKDALDRVFIGDESTKKLYLNAYAYVKALDRDSTLRYREPLTVAAERTLETILRSPEVASLLSALKSEALSQSAPQDPTARDELVQGSPSPSPKVDPFDEAAKDGETNFFDVAERFAGERKFQRAGHQ